MIEIKSLAGEVLRTLEADTLRGAYLGGADLGGANLGGADLRDAYLGGADLRGADLRGADLRDADLRGACLRGADLGGAYLGGADLGGANLGGANLGGAYLRGANLGGANLGGADLGGAYLGGANLPPFQIAAGELVSWKRCGVCVVELRIPREARRTGSLVGRKCRAEWAEVVAITGIDGQPVDQVASSHDESLIYRVGEIVRPDSYDDDPRIECTHGIHFFLTQEEAENYC